MLKGRWSVQQRARFRLWWDSDLFSGHVRDAPKVLGGCVLGAVVCVALVSSGFSEFWLLGLVPVTLVGLYQVWQVVEDFSALRRMVDGDEGLLAQAEQHLKMMQDEKIKPKDLRG